MGEAFIVRRGGVAEEVDTTATPTITEVSVTDSSITFTITNNDTDEAIVYYDLDPVVDFSVDSVTLDDGDTSSNITISDLDDDEEYIVYAIASAFGKQFSPQASLAITTDETFIPEFELLFDSVTAGVTYPTTDIDITGLSIGKNDELILTSTLETDDGHGFLLYVNGDVTNGNYTYQSLRGVGSTIDAGRANFPYFTLGRNGGTVTQTNIKVSNNDRYVFQSNSSMRIGGDSSSIENLNINVAGSQTVTSITSLKIRAGATNKIFTNSRFRLYKVNTGEA